MRSGVGRLIILVALLAAASQASAQSVFTHEIPIELPAGTGGMQPELALVYDPEVGNGIVGVGWRLRGLPLITRMNEGGGIRYTGGDTFVHSVYGVLVPQKDASGNVVMYRSRPESYVRFQPNGTCGDGPCSWTLTDRKGVKSYYGSGPNSSSRPEPYSRLGGLEGAFRTWALDRVQNLDGNSYEIRYLDVDAANEPYPDVIDYTINRAGGTIPRRRHVRFSYADRSDQEFSYAQGVPAWTRKVLTSIAIWSDDQDVSSWAGEKKIRTYHLVTSASEATGRLRLVSVRERGPAESGDVAATDDPSFVYAGPATFGAVTVSRTGGDNWGPDSLTTIGDYDGDGVMDIATARNESGNRTVTVKRPRFAWMDAGSWGGVSWGEYAVSGDFDGDAKWDVVSPRGGTLHLYRSTGASFTYTSAAVSTALPAAWQNRGRVMVADFDGDGRSEILSLNAPEVPGVMYDGNYLGGTVLVTSWDGARFQQTTWGSVPGTIARMFVGDYNGDGRADLAVLGATEMVWDGPYGYSWSQVGSPVGANGIAHMFFGRADGGADRATFAVPEFPFDPTGDRFNFQWAADFNADGKTDLAWKAGSTITVAYAHGDGFDARSYSGMGLWGGWVPHVADVNHDGRADIVSLNGDHAYVYLATSAGGFVVQDVAGYATSSGSSEARSWLADFTGDGNPDYAIAAGSDLHARQFFRTVAPDLLVAVNNGLNGRVTVTYGAATEVPNAIVPLPVEAEPPSSFPDQPWSVPYVGATPLVTAVVVFDGSRTYRTDYSYYDRRFLTGRIADRRYLHFGWISALEQSGRRTDTYYNQIARLEGSARRIEVHGRKEDGSDALLSVTDNEFASFERNGTHGIRLDRQVIRAFELVEHGIQAYARTTTLTYDPDGYGNLLAKQEEATGLPPVRTEYELIDDPARWIFGRELAITISAYDGGSWTRLQRTELVWNGDRVGRQDEWLDASGEMVSRWMTYDEVGNRTAITEPRPLASGPGPVTETAYDPAFRRYPIQVTRWIDVQKTARQIARAAYDVAGRVVCEADPNDVKKKLTYDARGRRTREWVEIDGDTTGCSPAQRGTARSDTAYRYDAWGTPDQSTTAIVKMADGRTREKAEYFDGSRFVFRTRESTADGRGICTLHEKKDPTGRVSRESLPFFCNQTTPVLWATTTWDSAGRKVRVEAPDGRATAFTYGVDFERATDSRGVSTTHHFDARRRVRRIVDGLGKATFYDYDAIGRLVRVQLPNGEVTTIGFDSLGRRTSIDAPQVGGANVAFEYDGFNRRTRSYEPQTGRTLATYTYDETAFANGQGRLTTVVDQSGTTQTSYDALGLPQTVVKRIDGKTYTHAFTYDLAGRPTSVLYPDGSAVEYGYTDGNVTSVSLVYNSQATWSDCRATPTPSGCVRVVIASYGEFTPGGQAQLVEYGNGTATRYQYDALGRLLTLRTTDRTGTAVQDLAYDWEAMEGITIGSIIDRRPDKSFRDPVTGEVIPSTDETQVYGYDDDYRLTSATGAWGTKTYAYDAIGNATAFGGATSRSLAYNGQQLTGGTGLADLRYDSAGNMLHRVLDGTAWDYQWTASGQLEQVRKAGVPVADLVYDADGKRTQKAFYPGGDPSRAVITTYVGNTYEERAFADDAGGLRTEHTLHVLAGDQVLLSVTRVGAQAVAFQELNRWRTELAAASMHDGTTLRGAGAKVTGWAHALGAHPETVRTVLLGSFALFAAVVLAGLAVTLRRGRDRRSWVLTPSLRTGAAALALVFTFTSCGRDPSGRAVGGGGVADALSGDAAFGVGAGWRYHHGNQVNSSSVITDGNGAVSTRIVYLPYGEVSSAHSGGPDSVTRKYTGQEADLELGLQYYQSRYYDPVIGRFISADPVVPNAADAQAFNRYGYVRNNPIVYLDPTGHSWLSRNWKAIVSVVIVVVLFVLAIVASCVPGLQVAAPYLWQAAIGAAIGAASGAAAAAAKGASWQDGMLVGAVVGGAAGAAAKAAGVGVLALTNGSHIAAGVATGAVVGAAQGFIAGWAGGAGTPDEIRNSVLIGLVAGAVLGGLDGWASHGGLEPYLAKLGQFGPPVGRFLATSAVSALLTTGATTFVVDNWRLGWGLRWYLPLPVGLGEGTKA